MSIRLPRPPVNTSVAWFTIVLALTGRHQEIRAANQTGRKVGVPPRRVEGAGQLPCSCLAQAIRQVEVREIALPDAENVPYEAASPGAAVPVEGGS